MDIFKWLAGSSGATSGSPYQILLPVALILIVAKGLSLLFEKIKVPQVIGFLVAGLLVGALKLIPDNPILSDYVMDGIDILAKFGVVMILFSAGIETNLKKVKQVGGAALIITSLGVIVPMGLGFLVAYLFRVLAGSRRISILLLSQKALILFIVTFITGSFLAPLQSPLPLLP